MTCKRFLSSSAGSGRNFMVACPLAAASLLSCVVVLERWIQPQFAVCAAFSSERWSHSVCNPVLYTHVWPACWLPAVDKSWASKSVEVLFMLAEGSRAFRGACRGVFRNWRLLCLTGLLLKCVC